MSEADDLERLTAGFGFDLSAREVVRDELARHLAITDGMLTEDEAERFATMAGCTSRTVRRWQQDLIRPATPPPASPPASRPPLGSDDTVLEALRTAGPDAFRFDDVMVSLMYLVHGNQSELRRLLIAGGYPMPSLPTMCRRWRQVNPMVRAGTKTGLKHRASKLLHFRHTAVKPNEAWEYDGFSVDIHVRAPHGEKVVRPNVLLLVDDRSRFIVSHMVIPRAMTAADVIATFGAGIEVRPADNGSGVLIGGWPDLIVTDNEAAIVAGGVRDAVEGLPTNLKICAAYSPHQKGKVERCGKTVQEMVVASMPGRVTGSERINKTHLLDVPAEDLLSWQQFVARFEQVVHEYNYERPHAALGGRTPFDVYSDRWEKRALADAELAELMLPVGRKGGARKVHSDGLHVFNGRFFLAAELADLIGEEVMVRSWYHRTDRVAVFVDGEFLCMAVDCSRIPEADRKTILGSRAETIREVLHHAAAARHAMSAVGAAIELADGASIVDVMHRAKTERLAEKDATSAPPPADDAGTGGDVAADDTSTETEPKAKRSKAARPSTRPPKNSTKKHPPKTKPTGDGDSVRRRARKIAESALDDNGVDDQTDDGQNGSDR